MNREEAITTLKNYIERITGGMFPGEREILVEAFDALRGPQPDPITGLVPCGCGGKAHVYLPVSAYSLYVIGCERCRVRITFPNKVNEAKNEWNRAMGWREDK